MLQLAFLWLSLLCLHLIQPSSPQVLPFFDEDNQEPATCGGCWCVNGDSPCPTQTFWYPQTYSKAMIEDFANKTLVDSSNNVVENLFSLDCNSYEGVSKDTNPAWKAYPLGSSGCQTTPPQVFSDTEADGYNEAVCAFSYPNFETTNPRCDTYTYATYPSKSAALKAGAYVTHDTQVRKEANEKLPFSMNRLNTHSLLAFTSAAFVQLRRISPSSSSTLI